MVYRSEADNLLSDATDTNGVADIFLYHISDGTQTRISYQSNGSETLQPSNNPSLAGTIPYMVYDKADTKQQSQIYAVDTSSSMLAGLQYSEDYNNFGELIDNTQPGISANGRYIAYLGQSKDESHTCTQHLLDRETGISEIILCSAEIKANPEQWYPLFDGTAENVHWQQIK